MTFGKTESRAKAFVEQMNLYMEENIVSQVSEKGVKAAEKLLKETPEDKKGDFWLEDLDVLTPEEDTGKCCFCGAVYDGRGNSTWPIYYEQDGEKNRCCEKCNEKVVVAARADRTQIMKFRKKFGISYERYETEE